MARATLRSVIVAAAIVALVVLLATPTAAAQDARLANCNNASCIIDTMLGGLVRIVSSVFLGLAGIGTSLLQGFADLVITPFLGIFGGFFGGLGKSLSNLGGAIFNDVGGAFSTAYTQLADSLRFFGPAAPLVATGVVLGILGMLAYAVVVAFDRANDPLPGFLERLVDPDDEDDDDDDAGR